MIKLKSRIWFVESSTLHDVYESSIEVSMPEAFRALVRQTEPEELGLIALAHTEMFPSDLEIQDAERFDKEVLILYVPNLLENEDMLE